MVTRPINPQLLPSRVYGRAAVGAVLPNYNQSLYSRIAAQRAAFLKSQPQTFYDPGLNPLVEQRIRNEYNINDEVWKSISKTIGAGAGAIIGSSQGAKTGASIGTALALILGNIGPQAAVPEEVVTVPVLAKIGSIIGGAFGAVTGGHTGSAIGGLASPSGLIAAGELLRNVGVSFAKDPGSGTIAAGSLALGGWISSKIKINGAQLSGFGRILVTGATSRVITKGYISVSDLMIERTEEEKMNQVGAMGSLGVIANTMDNFSGATLNKAMLASATGDKESFIDILGKAYGYNEEGFSQLDFTRIRENLNIDIGTLGNAGIDFIGELIVDPGIWYAHMRPSLEREIYQRTQTGVSITRLQTDVTSFHGRFIRKISMNRSTQLGISKAILESINESGSQGWFRSLSRKMNKNTPTSKQIFRDTIIKTGDKQLIALINQEAKLKNITAFEVIDSMFDIVKNDVISGIDSIRISRATQQQNGVNESRKVYDYIMNDPNLKDKSRFLDRAILKDLKEINMKITKESWNSLTTRYKTFRDADDIDNMMSMTTMSIVNPVMGALRYGPAALKRILGSDILNKITGETYFLKVKDVNGKTVYQLNSDAIQKQKLRTKEVQEQIKIQKEKIQIKREAFLKEEIKLGGKRAAEIQKAREDADKRYAELDKMAKHIKEVEERTAMYLFGASEIVKTYESLDEDTVKIINNKLKTLHKNDPERLRLERFVDEIKEIQNILKLHSIEIEILRTALLDIEVYKNMDDFEFDIFRMEYGRKVVDGKVTGSTIEVEDGYFEINTGRNNRDRRLIYEQKMRESNEEWRNNRIELSKRLIGLNKELKRLRSSGSSLLKNGNEDLIYNELKKHKNLISSIFSEEFINNPNVAKDLIGEIEKFESDKLQKGIESITLENIKNYNSRQEYTYDSSRSAYLKESTIKYIEYKGSTVEMDKIFTRQLEKVLGLKEGTLGAEMIAMLAQATKTFVKAQDIEKAFNIKITEEMLEHFETKNIIDLEDSTKITEGVIYVDKKGVYYKADDKGNLTPIKDIIDLIDEEYLMDVLSEYNLINQLITKNKKDRSSGKDSHDIEQDFYKIREDYKEGSTELKYSEVIDLVENILKVRNIDDVFLREGGYLVDNYLYVDGVKTSIFELGLTKGYLTPNEESFLRELKDSGIDTNTLVDLNTAYKLINMKKHIREQFPVGLNTNQNELMLNVAFENSSGLELLSIFTDALMGNLGDVSQRQSNAAGVQSNSSDAQALVEVSKIAASGIFDKSTSVQEFIQNTKNLHTTINLIREIGNTSSPDNFRVRTATLFDILRNRYYNSNIKKWFEWTVDGSQERYTVDERTFQKDLINFRDNLIKVYDEYIVDDIIRMIYDMRISDNTQYHNFKFQEYDKRIINQAIDMSNDIINQIVKDNNDTKLKNNTAQSHMVENDKKVQQEKVEKLTLINNEIKRLEVELIHAKIIDEILTESGLKKTSDSLNIKENIYRLHKQKESILSPSKPENIITEEPRFNDNDLHRLQGSFLGLTDELKEARMPITNRKYKNNYIKKFVFESNSVKKMADAGINVSTLAKEGYPITVRLSPSMRFESKIKGNFGKAFFQGTSKTDAKNIVMDLDTPTAGIRDGEFSDSVQRIYDIFKTHAFKNESDQSFLRFSEILSDAMTKGLKRKFVNIGLYYYEHHAKDNVDIKTLYQQLAYNVDIDIDSLKAVIGLTYMYSTNTLSDFNKILPEYKKFNEELNTEYENVKKLSGKTQEYSDASKLIMDILRSPSIVIEEKLKNIGVKITKELQKRIKRMTEDGLDKNYLTNDLIEIYMKDKHPDAFQTVDIKESQKTLLETAKKKVKYGGVKEVKLNNNETIVNNPVNIKNVNYPRMITTDIETTGLDNTKDSITQVVFVELENRNGQWYEVRRYNAYNSDTNKSKNTKDMQKLTNITNRKIDQEGISESEIVEKFSEVTSDPNTLIVAYNANFDINFINSLLIKHGKQPLTNDILDALAIYRDIQPRNSKLKTAGVTYDSKIRNTHNAIDDTMLTVDVLAKISNEVNVEDYINKFGYNPKYKVEDYSKIPYVDYYEQVPGSKAIGSSKKRKNKKRYGGTVLNKSEQERVDEMVNHIDKEIEKVDSITGKKKVLKRYTDEKSKIYEAIKTERDAKIESIKNKYEQKIQELREQKGDELGRYENNESYEKSSELIGNLSVNDIQKFKNDLRDELIRLGKSSAEADKIIIKIMDQYNTAQEVIQTYTKYNASVPTSYEVFDDVNKKYNYTPYTENREVIDGEIVYKRKMKDISELTEFEREQMLRESYEELRESLAIELELARTDGELEKPKYIYGTDPDSQELKRLYGTSEELNESYPVDKQIQNIENHYEMSLQQLTSLFLNRDGTVNYDEFMKFFERNEDLRLVAVGKARSNETRARNPANIDSIENLYLRAVISKAQYNKYKSQGIEYARKDGKIPTGDISKKLFDQEVQNFIDGKYDTDIPVAREIIIQSKEDLQLLYEQQMDPNKPEDSLLSIGMMGVENFKNAKKLSYSAFKLPAPLDYYYKTLLRVTKFDMLVRASFHVRNFIDVAMKNARIMDGIWDTPDYLHYYGKAWNQYGSWRHYQNELGLHRLKILDIYNGMESGIIRPDGSEVLALKDMLNDRVKYLQNELTKGHNDYQDKRDKESIKKLQGLTDGFSDPAKVMDTVLTLYQDYGTMGYGAYVRQHHIKYNTIAELEQAVQMGETTIDTKVYLKVKKSKEWKQAKTDLERQKIYEEYLEDEMSLIDLVNIFQKTSATTDQNKYLMESGDEVRSRGLDKDLVDWIVGSRPDGKGGKGNKVSNAYMRIGQQIEQVGRLQGYLLDRHLHGTGHNEAVARSLKRHYDYSDQTPLEKYATMIFPFVAFPTRNALWWAGRFQNASEIRIMHSFITALWGSVDEDERDNPYIQNAMINGYIPIGNTLVKLGGSKGSAFGMTLNPRQEATNRLNPLLREPINQLSGKGYKGLDLLRNVPFARILPELQQMRTRSQNNQVSKAVTYVPSLFGTIYRYDTDGRYRAKYENIYRNLYTAKGKQRTPSSDAYYRVRSIMYDMKRRQYAR